MNIVADESVDKQIVERLRVDGHDVLFIAELDPGIDDETVLGHSRQANAVLLTTKILESSSSASISFTLESFSSDSRVSSQTSRPN